MAGGAAVRCWCEVLPVCCCPVLYSYVGRGGVRSPTGAGHHRPGAGRRGSACPDSSGGRGIIGPAWPVRGDLSSGAGCCCPLLYDYVGRGGGRSPTGAASSARRGAAAGFCLSRQQRRRGVISYRRGIIEPPTENAPEKSPHGKQATKKEVNAARAVSTSFFASFFRGGHSSGVSSGAGGWNPSRAILSRVAFTIYPATLSPAWAAAVFKSSSISFGILIDFVANFDK
ncbi:MAG: hypothetical protein [Bacteriophage sp.]|nr:MAG: hypothetical protein [Bacteriophage sp.]